MSPGATAARQRPHAIALAAAVWVGLVGLSGSREAAAQAARPPRAVAVIDATADVTSDPPVTTFAARLESQLDRETELVPVAPEQRPALVGAIPDRRRAATQEARSAVGRARAALARFDHAGAVGEAERGVRRLLDLAPDDEITNLVADLVFARGLARLGQGDPGAASADFALVHRLAPGRTLDPVRHRPQVIEQFERAAAAGALTQLTVDAPAGAEVWIDGAAIGPAPVTVAVGEGLHAVVVTGERLVPRGLLVEARGAEATARLETADATGTMIVHRLRRRLAAADDDEARRGAVAAIVRTVGAQDAVVVGRDEAGALVTRLYSGRTGELGEARPVEGLEPRDVLAPIRPLPPPRLPEPDGRRLPPPPPSPWYERRWAQVGIGSSIAAGVLGAVVFAMTRPTGESQLETARWRGDP
jgi:hypothetical protein